MGSGLEPPDGSSETPPEPPTALTAPAEAPVIEASVTRPAPVLGTILLGLFAPLLTGLVGAVLVLFVAAFLPGAPRTRELVPWALRSAPGMAALLLLQNALLALWAWNQAGRRELPRRTWLRLLPVRFGVLDVLLLVGLAGGVFGISALASVWSRQLGLPADTKMLEQIVTTFQDAPGISWLLLVLALGIGPGIGEEIWLRGHILRALEMRYRVRTAIVVSALLFAALHLNPVQIVFALPFGLVFGWLAIRCGSILPGMFCHAIVNSGVNLARAIEVRKPGYVAELQSQVVEANELWQYAGLLAAGLVAVVWLERRFRRAALPAIGVVALLAAPAFAQQEPDTTFDTRVARPALAERAPRLLFDEAHHEFHRMAERYRPFADLARNDGWRVAANAAALDSAVLASGDLLVVANALGDEDMDTPEAANPAFTPAEIAAVERWVSNGGALLLIADHAPMGAAARSLGEAFGVDMRAAYTADKERAEKSNETILHFRTGKGLDDTHPIILGRDSTERVRHVHTFTGQSLSGPPGAVQLLTLSGKAEDLLVNLGQAGGRIQPQMRKPAGGRAQGLAFEHGRGRVVILGEAAMMTAQIAGRSHKMGMNVPGSDDRQFALNVLRWLARAL